jgi:hypothetical protein
LLFQVAESSQSNPSGNYSNDNQSPIRPKRVSRPWYLARLLGLPFLLGGGWLRYRRRRNVLSFILFLLGGCILFGPRLP